MTVADLPHPPADIAVLLLDDDNESRELSAEIFATKAVRVVEAATKVDAERELISHPGIDAVSLDVSLHGGGKDKEGAELAVRIREARPDLPIVGYSAYFEEGDLSAEERDAFTAYYHRGGTTTYIGDYVDRCLDEGLRYRQRRRDIFAQQLADLSAKGQLAEREYSVLRSFSPADGEDLSIERALTGAGYQVEVVLPTPPQRARYVPRRPFVVWIRRVENSEDYEAEVFGQPSLYGVGSSSEGAVRSLIEVFWLFADELADAPQEDLIGPALSLAHFFEHVLSMD
jgi:CheY-like chemotaxis protein